MFLPTFYVEPETLASPDTLNYVRDTYLSHKNWYLWWGLKGQTLVDRSKETVKIVQDMHEEYEYEMRNVPRFDDWQNTALINNDVGQWNTNKIEIKNV
ncbi:hypothetical protein [Shewanella woodyi]|uniref:hypothetical protein n=1 Tax=Shewanella woodyi TaxID=60961 RepID=UPI0037498E1C